MGPIRKSAMQVFSKEVFWLFLQWMCSLLDGLYETPTFFQITGSDDVIFINNWWNFAILGGIFKSPEPSIVWSRATPHFIQKTELIINWREVIILKNIILRNGSGLKVLFLTKMTILGSFMYFLYRYSYEIASPLKLIQKS